MRGILFRGKRRDNNHWTYGSLILDVDVCRIHVYGTGESREVFPDTVGQFTGMKDKNRIDIYEGDIVGKGHGEIYWDEKHAQFRVRWHERVFRRVRGGNGEPLFANCEIAWEIIGNIHDNPELVNQPNGGALNMNIDPNVKAEEATQQEIAPESAALNAAEDQANDALGEPTQDSEEGSTEG